jgi:glutamate dehydrogenase/leucine dehydrogenase
VFPF